MSRWSPGRIAAATVAVAVATVATISVIAVIGHPDVAHVAGPCVCGAAYITCSTDPDHCDGGDRLAGGAVVVAVGKSPKGWNPGSSRGNAGDTAEELTPVLPSAYTFLPSGKIDYNRDLLAGEPQVITTGGVRVVYRISEHAVWNDGSGGTRPVTAQDFVFAWRTHDRHDKNLPVWPAPGYDQIANVVGGDGDRTVTVTLKQPYADWPGLFTLLEPYWFAAAAAGADPADAARMTDSQLETAFAALQDVPKFSAGPYQIKEVGLDGSTVEVPNTRWYGAIKPTLTTITFRETDDRQNTALLRGGDIDAFTAAGPDLDTVQALADTPGINFHVEPGYAWEQLTFNTADPFLRDAKLRAAIMDVIDVQALIDRTAKPTFPDARPLYSHNMFPGQAAYQDIARLSDPTEGTGDLDDATRLLAAAGYTGIGRANALKTPDGRHVTVTLTHTDTVARDVAAGMIGDDIARLGATVTDRPTSDLYGTLTGRRFGIAEFGLATGPMHATNVDLWSTRGGSNFTGWGNARSDALLAAAARTMDAVQQAMLLNEQDKILTAAHVDLPLYQLPQLIAVDSRYVAIRLDPAGGYITYNTQEWGLLKALR